MKQLAFIAGVLLCVAASASAQEPARLSLAIALESASRQNLDLIAARQRRAIALAAVRTAGQRPNPVFTFTASRDLPHQGLEIAQPFEVGPKRQRRIQVAEQERSLTDVEISTLERQVRRNTREAYFRLALARAESERQARLLELSQRLRDIAQARYDAGSVPQLEVIQADLEASRAKVDLQVAKQRERVALSELNALLNEPAGKDWALESRLADALPALAVSELLQRAYESNPELQHLERERLVEHSRRELLRAERIPDVDVSFGTDLNSPPDFRAGAKGGFSLVLPLFTRNQGEIAQSTAQERFLETSIAATRRSVSGRVEAAYLELQAQQVQVDLYRQQLLPSVRQIESLAEESYKAGKSNLLVLLDARRRVQELERIYLESLFDLQSAFASLEETVGRALD